MCHPPTPGRLAGPQPCWQAALASLSKVQSGMKLAFKNKKQLQKQPKPWVPGPHFNFPVCKRKRAAALQGEVNLDAFWAWRNQSHEATPYFFQDLSSPVHSSRKSKEQTTSASQESTSPPGTSQHRARAQLFLKVSLMLKVESKTILSLTVKQR